MVTTDRCAICGDPEDGQWVVTGRVRYRLCYLCAYHQKKDS